MSSEVDPPVVSIEFLVEQGKNSDVIDAYDKVGHTHVFIKQGVAPLRKRLRTIRDLESGAVDYDFAISFAVHFKFLGALMDWCSENKAYVEGGYSATQKAKKKD